MQYPRPWRWLHRASELREVAVVPECRSIGSTYLTRSRSNMSLSHVTGIVTLPVTVFELLPSILSRTTWFSPWSESDRPRSHAYLRIDLPRHPSASASLSHLYLPPSLTLSPDALKREL